MIESMVLALQSRGLKVTPTRATTHLLLDVAQPLVPPAAEASRGDIDCTLAGLPGLSQTVVFINDPERPPGNYAWALLWGTQFRGAGDPDVQRISNGEDWQHAAELIGRVLHVRT
jgi:hypothetical protein